MGGQRSVRRRVYQAAPPRAIAAATPAMISATGHTPGDDSGAAEGSAPAFGSSPMPPTGRGMAVGVAAAVGVLVGVGVVVGVGPAMFVGGAASVGLRPITSTGVLLFVVVPFPSWPKAL